MGWNVWVENSICDPFGWGVGRIKSISLLLFNSLNFWDVLSSQTW